MKIGYLNTKTATILWDLGRLEKDIEMRRLSTERRCFPVVDLIGQCLVLEADALLCDVSILPIVFSFAPDKYRVMTGREQVRKARLLGFRELPCHFIKPGQHKRYIIDYDEASYLRAVEEYSNWDEDWDEDLDEE